MLTALGGLPYWQRDLPGGEAASAEAARLAEQAGDPQAVAEALYNLSFALWHQGRLSDAEEVAERSRRLFAEVGDDSGTARVLWLRGVLAVLERRFATAEELLREAVVRHRARGDAFPPRLAAAHARQDLPAAAATRRGAPSARGGLASLRAHRRRLRPDPQPGRLRDARGPEGDVERELRLVGAVRRLHRITGVDLVEHPINHVPELEQVLAGAGPDGVRLLAEGEAMSDAESVRYALGEDGPGPEEPRP